MARITLQEIPAAEQDELRAMVAAYWAELVPEAPVARAPRRAAAYFADQFRFGDDAVTLWWAMAETAKVGFVRVERWHTEDERGTFIRDFYIRLDRRRQGIGTAVVQVIRAVAADEGWVRLDLNVRADNPHGLAFWGAQGFQLQLYQLRQFVARCRMITAQSTQVWKTTVCETVSYGLRLVGPPDTTAASGGVATVSRMRRPVLTSVPPTTGLWWSSPAS